MTNQVTASSRGILMKEALFITLAIFSIVLIPTVVYAVCIFGLDELIVNATGNRQASSVIGWLLSIFTAVLVVLNVNSVGSKIFSPKNQDRE